MSKHTQYATIVTTIDKGKYDQRRIAKLSNRQTDLNMHALEGFVVVNTITINEEDDVLIVDTLSKTTDND